MHHLLSKARAQIFIIAGFCCLLLFLIWNQLLHQIAQDRQETISKAVHHNSNLAVTLEQYAISTIKQADQVLRMVKMEYEKKGSSFRFDPLADNHIIDLKHIEGISIINANGRLQQRNFSAAADANIDFSDREHFIFHKANRDSLFISKPILSRTLHKMVIVLSRRINNRDGSFGGTVAIQIDPATFTRFYSQAKLSALEIISLIAPDGITYARRTGNKESTGENIHKSPLFYHLAKNKVGAYYAADAIHGVPTFFSYRQLQDYPVIATVGSARQDVLAGFYTRAQREYIFGGSITFLLVLFSTLSCAAIIARRANHRRIKDSEIRYRSLFENSHDGIILLSPDGCIEAINKSAFALFKLDALPEGKVYFSQLFAQSVPEIGGTNGTDLSMEESEKEIRFTCSNNSEFIGEMAYSYFMDSGGSRHLVINIRDVTSRRQMEQSLLREQKRFQRKLTRQIIVAQERERELIGHELHDNVNQILATVKLYLEMAQSHPETRDDLLPKSIGHVMNCITEIRNLSHALSAPTLGTQSLIDSVSALVETVESSSGIKINFKHDAYKTSIIKDQKLAIYRILQEQLTNIIKHAEATEVTIELAQAEDTTEINITDNGKGFDTTIKSTGIGFSNILSRAKVFGGRLLIESQPGSGCRLHISIPIICKKAGLTQNSLNGSVEAVS